MNDVEFSNTDVVNCSFSVDSPTVFRDASLEGCSINSDGGKFMQCIFNGGSLKARSEKEIQNCTIGESTNVEFSQNP